MTVFNQRPFYLYMKLFLDEVFYHALGKKIDYSSVIQVGSNAQLDFFLQSVRLDSDIDIIVITGSESYQTKIKFRDKLFDISFVNSSSCVQLIDSALNGSPFAGKLFSSSKNHNILIDNNGIGENFIRLANYIYDLFKLAVRPNHSLNSLFKTNINVNKNDLIKESTFENYFIKHRLFSHLTDYISALNFPFSTSGKYRGQVFKEFGFNSLEKVNNSLDFVTQFISKYEPIYNCSTKDSYLGIVYSDFLENSIMDGKIDDFFFGYDNIVEETLLVFIHRDSFLNLSGNDCCQIFDINNNIPTMNKNEAIEYYSIMRILSSKYFDKHIRFRLNMFYNILNQIDTDLQNVFEKSVKASIIQKTCKKLISEETYIEFDTFYNWVLNFHFKIEPDLITTNIKVDEELKLFSCSNNDSNSRLTLIKNNYILFGLMKALRIKLEDLKLI
ncbi:hypothetical protein MHTCC0001_00140 [Flavobacteriaceae bacterium MHTCC 0001]